MQGRRAAIWSTTIDQILLAIPFFGKMRQAFALARFCATYDMQLEAGVNVIDSLSIAARASCSAVIADAAQRSVPEIRTGSQLGSLLARSRAFPDELIQAWRVAEETGGL